MAFQSGKEPFYFERLVGSVKRCLKKVLGNARLKLDELRTVLIEVGGTLNPRQLPMCMMK